MAGLWGDGNKKSYVLHRRQQVVAALGNYSTSSRFPRTEAGMHEI